MKIQESGENYLETVYILQQRQGNIRAIDVATELGYSKASVSRALGILRRAGYLVVDGVTGLIAFTPMGLDKAKSVYERHRCIKRFLISLGVDEEAADRDACRMEHVIGEQTFDAIRRSVECEP